MGLAALAVHAGTLVYNLYAIHQQEVDAAAHLASGGHELKVGSGGCGTVDVEHAFASSSL